MPQAPPQSLLPNISTVFEANVTFSVDTASFNDTKKYGLYDTYFLYLYVEISSGNKRRCSFLGVRRAAREANLLFRGQ
jgi:hypothetical protein